MTWRNQFVACFIKSFECFWWEKFPEKKVYFRRGVMLTPVTSIPLVSRCKFSVASAGLLRLCLRVRRPYCRLTSCVRDSARPRPPCEALAGDVNAVHHVAPRGVMTTTRALCSCLLSSPSMRSSSGFTSSSVVKLLGGRGTRFVSSHWLVARFKEFKLGRQAAWRPGAFGLVSSGWLVALFM